MVESEFRFVVCDVFTDQPLTGNQLAVFTDARDIPEGALQVLVLIPQAGVLDQSPDQEGRGLHQVASHPRYAHGVEGVVLRRARGVGILEKDLAGVVPLVEEAQVHGLGRGDLHDLPEA